MTADALDRLLERFPDPIEAWDAVKRTPIVTPPGVRLDAGDIWRTVARPLAEAGDALREALIESNLALVALREQHDALKAALRTVLATMDDGKDFHAQTEALEAARALLGNAVGEAL